MFSKNSHFFALDLRGIENAYYLSSPSLLKEKLHISLKLRFNIISEYIEDCS